MRLTSAPPVPAPPTVQALLRTQTRYYQGHVLAWYALGRGHDARACWAAVCDLRGRLADAQAGLDASDPAVHRS